MLKKYVFGTLAIVMAVVFSAFTAPSKADANVKSTDLYWYEVNMQGQVPQNATPVIHGQKNDAEALDLCPQGNDIDCLRGFTNQLNTSNGPVSTPGEDKIERAQP